MTEKKLRLFGHIRHMSDDSKLKHGRTDGKNKKTFMQWTDDVVKWCRAAKALPLSTGLKAIGIISWQKIHINYHSKSYCDILRPTETTD